MTIEQIGAIIGSVGGAMLIWKGALSAAKSVLQREVDDRLAKLEGRVQGIEDDQERSIERIDKLYDRLIQKNS